MTAADSARYKAERDFERQRTQHHIKRARELESIISHLIAASKTKRCKCSTAQAVRALAAELNHPERAR